MRVFSTFVLILFCLFNIQINSQELNNESLLNKTQLSVGADYSSYSSYSQLKTNLPMNAGYPEFFANSFEIHGEFILKKTTFTHFFKLSAGYFGDISSDDGTGRNYLLNKNESNLYKIFFQYYFLKNLFEVLNIQTRFGFSSGILYDNKSLNFKGKSSTKRWEISTALGAVINANYPITKSINISAQFNSLFFIPYLSFGNYKINNSKGQIFQSSFYSFTYNTIFKIGLGYKISDNSSIFAGYIKNDQFGFANSSPSFTIDHLITYRIERLHQFFMEYTFGIN